MKTKTHFAGRSLVRSCGRLIAGLALVALPACASHREVVSTRTVSVDRNVIPPPRMVDISIVDLHDMPSPNPAMETLAGTIVNHGDRAVSQLSVRVDALDDAGRVVHSVTTPPVAQTIAPLGGQANFEASLPRSPAVTGFHAEAVAR